MLHHFLDIQLLIINKIKKHYRVRLTSRIQGYSECLCHYIVCTTVGTLNSVSGLLMTSCWHIILETIAKIAVI